MNGRSAALAILLAPLAAACSEPAPDPMPRPAAAEPRGEAPLVVAAVNYPLAYFAERIGGEGVEVVFPAPADVDPAYWSPEAATVARIQRADLVLLNGAGYARWVERVSLPRARLVDTSAAFRERYLPLDGAVSHTHGPEGEHSHRGYASTTWLDPLLALEQARAVRDAFSRRLPERAESFGAAFEELAAELRRLDERLAAVARTLEGQPLFFSHPVYDYLSRRYALDAEALHFEPDQEPDATMWRELEELRRNHPARWMIWEDAPLESTRSRLAEAGIASLVYRPCANRPPEGDLLAAMSADLEAIEGALDLD